MAMYSTQEQAMQDPDDVLDQNFVEQEDKE